MFDSDIINRELKKYLPADNSVLSKAMRYSVFAGGKRFRPGIMLATAKMLKGKIKNVLPAAAAVEMIHTFTLIHDDLPSMDNSDLRRGKPTCHKKFGEDIALLAGDALNTLAFNIIAKEPAVVKELSKALLDVVSGQVLDLKAEKKKITLSELKSIHLKKTAALIKVSVKIAAILSGAREKQINLLGKYGQEMGLAFQIADDILDFASTSRILGKPAGADRKNYPIILGLEKAKKLAQKHHKKAVSYLASFGKSADSLLAIADFAVRRVS